jgi:hypothetical protein
MLRYSGKALSIIVVSLLATLALAYAVPQTSSPPNNNSNPFPFNNERAPVSGTVSTYLNLIQNRPSNIPTAAGLRTSLSSSISADPTTVFNLDNSPLPQNEESTAVNPATTTVVGGYNDYRGLLTLLNISPAGFTGFSVSNDGGATVRTDGDLPKITLPLTSSATLSGGDPAVDSSNTGTFYLSNLYYNFSTSKFAGCPKKAPCESAILVFPSVSSTALSSCLGTSCWGSPKAVVDTTFTETPGGGVFNDKDWMTVDRTSHASGLYVTYTAFNLLNSQSTIDIVRCTYDLSTCSGSIIISGPDISTQGSFVAVRPDGSLSIVYASYDTIPLRIRGVQCSPGTGVTVTCTAPTTIASIPFELIALTNDDFRVALLPQLAVDYSSAHPDRVIVVWNECKTEGVSGTTFIILTCPQPLVRAAYTDATAMAGPWTTVNITSSGIFPTVAIDPSKGTVNIAYYSTINDTWAHRLDLYVSQYPSGAFPSTPTIIRVTAASDEPDADPLLHGGFFGDYIQATATAGTVYLGYTANYAQKGTPPSYGQDNYLTTMPD